MQLGGTQKYIPHSSLKPNSPTVYPYISSNRDYLNFTVTCIFYNIKLIAHSTAEEKVPGVLTIQSRKLTRNRNLIFIAVLFTYTE